VFIASFHGSVSSGALSRKKHPLMIQFWRQSARGFGAIGRNLSYVGNRGVFSSGSLMYDFFRFLEQLLDRGEVLTTRECLSSIALLTLVSYLVLLVSGRGRS
jgi:hypothetical protein